MGNGFGHMYKHSQPKCTYPSPNSTCVVSPCSLFTSQQDRSNDFGVTVIAHNQPSHVSNLTTTTQVDTDSKNYDGTHFNSRKNNHITLKYLKQIQQLLPFRLLLFPVYAK